MLHAAVPRKFQKHFVSFTNFSCFEGKFLGQKSHFKKKIRKQSWSALGNLTSKVNELLTARLQCCNLTTRSPVTRTLTRTALVCMTLICTASICITEIAQLKIMYIVAYTNLPKLYASQSGLHPTHMAWVRCQDTARRILTIAAKVPMPNTEHHSPVSRTKTRVNVID